MEPSRKGHGIKLFDVGPFSRQKKDKDNQKGNNTDTGSTFSPALSTSSSSSTSTTPSPEKKSRPFSRLLSRSKDRKDESKPRKDRSPSTQPLTIEHECNGGGTSPSAGENGDLGSERDGCPTRNRNYNTLPTRMSLFGGKLTRPKSSFLNVDDEKKSLRSSPSILRAGSRLSIFDFRKSNLSLTSSLKSSSDRGESDGDRDSRREGKRKGEITDGAKRASEEESEEKKKDNKQNIKSLGKKIKKGISSLFHHKKDKRDKDSGVDEIRESDEDSASAVASTCEKTDDSDLDSESIGNFSMSSNCTSLYDDIKSIDSESTLSRHEQKSVVSVSTISDGGSQMFNDNRDFQSKIAIIDAVRDSKYQNNSLEMARKVFGSSDQPRTEERSRIPSSSDVHSKNFKTLTAENSQERTVIPNMGMHIYEKKTITRPVSSGVYDLKGPERIIPPNMGTNICAKRTQEVASASPKIFGSTKEPKKGIASFLNTTEVRCLYSTENALKPQETRGDHKKPYFGSNSDLSYKGSPVFGVKEFVRRAESVNENSGSSPKLKSVVTDRNNRNERFSSPLTRPAIDKTNIRGVTQSNKKTDHEIKTSGSLETLNKNEILQTLNNSEMIFRTSQEELDKILTYHENVSDSGFDKISRTHAQVQASKFETSSATTNAMASTPSAKPQKKSTGSASTGNEDPVTVAAAAIIRALQDKGVKDITEDTIRNVLASTGITGRSDGAGEQMPIRDSTVTNASSELESSDSDDDLEFYDSVDASEVSDTFLDKDESHQSETGLSAGIIKRSHDEIMGTAPYPPDKTVYTGGQKSAQVVTESLSISTDKDKKYEQTELNNKSLHDKGNKITSEVAWKDLKSQPNFYGSKKEESLLKKSVKPLAGNGISVSASSPQTTNQLKIKDDLKPRPDTTNKELSTTPCSSTPSKPDETDTFSESDEDEEFIEAASNSDDLNFKNNAKDDNFVDQETEPKKSSKDLAMRSELEKQTIEETFSKLKPAHPDTDVNKRALPEFKVEAKAVICETKKSSIVSSIKNKDLSLSDDEHKEQASRTLDLNPENNEQKQEITTPKDQRPDIMTTLSVNKVNTSNTEQNQVVSVERISNKSQKANEVTVHRRSQRDYQENGNRFCAIIEVASSSDDNEDEANLNNARSNTVLRIGTFGTSLKGEESDDTGYLESSDSTTTSIYCLEDEETKVVNKEENHLNVSHFSEVISVKNSMAEKEPVSSAKVENGNDVDSIDFVNNEKVGSTKTRKIQEAEELKTFCDSSQETNKDTKGTSVNTQAIRPIHPVREGHQQIDIDVNSNEKEDKIIEGTETIPIDTCVSQAEDVRGKDLTKETVVSHVSQKKDDIVVDQVTLLASQKTDTSVSVMSLKRKGDDNSGKPIIFSDGKIQQLADYEKSGEHEILQADNSRNKMSAEENPVEIPSRSDKQDESSSFKLVKDKLTDKPSLNENIIKAEETLITEKTKECINENHGVSNHTKYTERKALESDDKNITERSSEIDDVTVNNDSNWTDKRDLNKQNVSLLAKGKDKNIQKKETSSPSFKKADSLERKPPISSNEDVRELSAVAMVPTAGEWDGKEIQDDSATSSEDAKKPCKRIESLKDDVTESSTDVLPSTPLDSDGKKIKHDIDASLVKIEKALSETSNKQTIPLKEDTTESLTNALISISHDSTTSLVEVGKSLKDESTVKDDIKLNKDDVLLSTKEREMSPKKNKEMTTITACKITKEIISQEGETTTAKKRYDDYSKLSPQEKVSKTKERDSFEIKKGNENEMSPSTRKDQNETLEPSQKNLEDSKNLISAKNIRETPKLSSHNTQQSYTKNAVESIEKKSVMLSETEDRTIDFVSLNVDKPTVKTNQEKEASSKNENIEEKTRNRKKTRGKSKSPKGDTNSDNVDQNTRPKEEGMKKTTNNTISQQHNDITKIKGIFEAKTKDEKGIEKDTCDQVPSSKQKSIPQETTTKNVFVKVERVSKIQNQKLKEEKDECKRISGANQSEAVLVENKEQSMAQESSTLKMDVPKTEKLTCSGMTRKTPEKNLETVKSVKGDEKHGGDLTVSKNDEVIMTTECEKASKDCNDASKRKKKKRSSSKSASPPNKDAMKDETKEQSQLSVQKKEAKCNEDDKLPSLVKTEKEETREITTTSHKETKSDTSRSSEERRKDKDNHLVSSEIKENTELTVRNKSLLSKDMQGKEIVTRQASPEHTTPVVYDGVKVRAKEGSSTIPKEIEEKNMTKNTPMVEKEIEDKFKDATSGSQTEEMSPSSSKKKEVKSKTKEEDVKKKPSETSLSLVKEKNEAKHSLPSSHEKDEKNQAKRTPSPSTAKKYVKDKAKEKSPFSVKERNVKTEVKETPHSVKGKCLKDKVKETSLRSVEENDVKDKPKETSPPSHKEKDMQDKSKVNLSPIKEKDAKDNTRRITSPLNIEKDVKDEVKRTSPPSINANNLNDEAKEISPSAIEDLKDTAKRTSSPSIKEKNDEVEVKETYPSSKRKDVNDKSRETSPPTKEKHLKDNANRTSSPSIKEKDQKEKAKRTSSPSVNENEGKDEINETSSSIKLKDVQEKAKRTPSSSLKEKDVKTEAKETSPPSIKTKDIEDETKETTISIKEKDVNDKSKETSPSAKENHLKDNAKRNSSPSIKQKDEKEKAKRTSSPSLKEKDMKTEAKETSSPIIKTKDVEDETKETSISIKEKDVKNTSKETSPSAKEKHLKDNAKGNSSPSIKQKDEKEKAKRTSSPSLKEKDMKTEAKETSSPIIKTKDVEDETKETSISIKEKDVKNTSKETSPSAKEKHLKDNAKGNSSPSIKQKDEKEKAKRTSSPSLKEKDMKTEAKETSSPIIKTKDVEDETKETSISIKEKDVKNTSKETSPSAKEKHLKDNAKGNSSPSIKQKDEKEKAKRTSSPSIKEKDMKTEAKETSSPIIKTKDVEDETKETSISIKEKDVKNTSKETSPSAKEKHLKDNAKGNSSPSIKQKDEKEKAKRTSSPSIKEKDMKTEAKETSSPIIKTKDVEDETKETSISIKEKDVKNTSKETSPSAKEKHLKDNAKGNSSPSIKQKDEKEKAKRTSSPSIKEKDMKTEAKETSSPIIKTKDVEDETKETTISIKEKDVKNTSKETSPSAKEKHLKDNAKGNSSPSIKQKDEKEKAKRTSSPSIKEKDMKTEAKETSSPIIKTKDVEDETKETSISIKEKDVKNTSKETSPSAKEKHLKDNAKRNSSPSIKQKDEKEKAKRTSSPSIKEKNVKTEAKETSSPSIKTKDVKDKTRETSPSAKKEDFKDNAKRTSPPSLKEKYEEDKSKRTTSPSTKENELKDKAKEISSPSIKENDVTEMARRTSSPSTKDKDEKDKAKETSPSTKEKDVKDKAKRTSSPSITKEYVKDQARKTSVGSSKENEVKDKAKEASPSPIEKDVKDKTNESSEKKWMNETSPSPIKEDDVNKTYLCEKDKENMSSLLMNKKETLNKTDSSSQEIENNQKVGMRKDTEETIDKISSSSKVGDAQNEIKDDSLTSSQDEAMKDGEEKCMLSLEAKDIGDKPNESSICSLPETNAKAEDLSYPISEPYSFVKEEGAEVEFKDEPKTSEVPSFPRYRHKKENESKNSNKGTDENQNANVQISVIGKDSNIKMVNGQKDSGPHSVNPEEDQNKNKTSLEKNDDLTDYPEMNEREALSFKNQNSSKSHEIYPTIEDPEKMKEIFNRSEEQLNDDVSNVNEFEIISKEDVSHETKEVTNTTVSAPVADVAGKHNQNNLSDSAETPNQKNDFKDTTNSSDFEIVGKVSSNENIEQDTSNLEAKKTESRLEHEDTVKYNSSEEQQNNVKNVTCSNDNDMKDYVVLDRSHDIQEAGTDLLEKCRKTSSDELDFEKIDSFLVSDSSNRRPNDVPNEDVKYSIDNKHIKSVTESEADSFEIITTDKKSTIKVQTPDKNSTKDIHKADIIKESETPSVGQKKSDVKSSKSEAEKKPGVFSTLKRMFGFSSPANEAQTPSKPNKNDEVRESSESSDAKLSQKRKEIRISENDKNSDVEQPSYTSKDEKTDIMNKNSSFKLGNNNADVITDDFEFVSKDPLENEKSKINEEKKDIENGDKKCQNTFTSEAFSISDLLSSSENYLDTKSKSSTTNSSPNLVSKTLKKDEDTAKIENEQRKKDTESSQIEEQKSKTDKEKASWNEKEEPLRHKDSTTLLIPKGNLSGPDYYMADLTSKDLSHKENSPSTKNHEKEANEKQRIKKETVKTYDKEIEVIVEEKSTENLCIKSEQCSVNQTDSEVFDKSEKEQKVTVKSDNEASKEIALSEDIKSLDIKDLEKKEHSNKKPQVSWDKEKEKDGEDLVTLADALCNQTTSPTQEILVGDQVSQNDTGKIQISSDDNAFKIHQEVKPSKEEANNLCPEDSWDEADMNTTHDDCNKEFPNCLSETSRSGESSVLKEEKFRSKNDHHCRSFDERKSENMSQNEQPRDLKSEEPSDYFHFDDESTGDKLEKDFTKYVESSFESNTENKLHNRCRKDFEEDLEYFSSDDEIEEQNNKHSMNESCDVVPDKKSLLQNDSYDSNGDDHHQRKVNREMHKALSTKHHEEDYFSDDESQRHHKHRLTKSRGQQLQDATELSDTDKCEQKYPENSEKDNVKTKSKYCPQKKTVKRYSDESSDGQF